MTVPKIVIDTNVIVSGLRSRLRASFRLLQLIGTGRFHLNISVPLILEYEDVILRHLPILTLDRDDVDDLLDYLCSVSSQHEIHYLWRPTLKDPNDEMLLELAVKAQCDFVVTHNKKDFKGISYFGIETIDPAEFLKKIGN